MSKLRTNVLTALGTSWVARSWASRKCRQDGVQLNGRKDAVELQRGNYILRLAPKHIFFAPKISASFNSFTRVLPATEKEGKSVVDFAANPDALNRARMCLSYGVMIEAREGNVWLRKDNRAMVLAPHHFVYALDMAEKFELYFAPLVPIERDGLMVLDYSRPGTLQKYAKSGLEFEMASFPEEEEAIEEYFRWYKPKAGDLVFDIGAHCGVSTYHLAKLVGPEGKVVAFEPDPGNFSILRRNIERHGLINVDAQNVAIAGKSGKLSFNAEGTIGSSLSSLLQRETVGTTVMVEAITLKEAFTCWGTPDFCKIDIEGAEVEALAAAADILSRSSTYFALDTNHPQPNGKMTDKPVEEMLRSYGYEVASEANPLLTTWARPRK